MDKTTTNDQMNTVRDDGITGGENDRSLEKNGGAYRNDSTGGWNHNLNNSGGSNGYSPWIKISAAFLCLTAVVIKLLFYYKMMGMTSYLDVTILVTVCLLALLFNSFKRKVIPAVIYLFLSILMVADVAYYSFFNRYLSVSMVGAAGMLGDVQNSVWEVLKPNFFLLLGDSVLIMGILLMLSFYKNNLGQAAADEDDSLIVRVWNATASETGRLKSMLIGFLCISCLMVMSPSGDLPLSAVVNQEFFTYHLKDASGMLDNSAESDFESIGDILAVTGNYEQEKKGPEFGVGKGKNLVVIQVEAMQNFVIGAEYKGKEITPNINKLLKEDTFYFDTYYQQLGSGNTSDSEFATNNSLYGSMKSYTYEIFKDNYFRGLPVQLKEQGYTALAFHAFDRDFWSREDAYPGQGFDDFYSGEDFEEGPMLGMGLADKAMFQQSTEILKEQDKPFYAFMITLSSHHPFDISGDLDISEDTESIFQNYIQSMNYVDSAVGEFIQELKDAGLYDNTIIALYGDHFGLNPKDEEVQRETSEFLGKDYWYEEAMNIPLFIHVPGSGVSKTVSVPGGQSDFLPTIAYLMGFDRLDTLYFGHNLLTVKDNFIPIRAYVQRGSFVTGDIMFQMANNRIFSDSRAVNIRTGEEVPIDDLKELYVKSVQLTNTSDFYLESDILRKIYLEGGKLEDFVGNAAEAEAEEIITVPYYAAVIDGTLSDAGNGVYCYENLDELYNNGYREIKVNAVYDSQGSLYILKDPADLGNYFKRPKDSYTYEEFEKAKQRLANRGVTPMSIENLASWMEAHPDAVIVMSASKEIIGDRENQKHSIYLIKEFMTAHQNLQRQVVFSVSTGEEVERANLEGYQNVIFDISGQGYTAEQLKDFMTLYKMYALAMTETELESYQEVLKEWDGGVYILRDQLYDEKTLEESNLTGVIINEVSW